MSYSKDLHPLVDQLEIIFKLEIKPELFVLVSKYGTTTLIQKNSKLEFSKLIKEGLKKTLINLSKNYIEKLLLKYFSEEGLTMFISNTLIDLSKVVINNELTKLRETQ
ncbi:MAG: hypothetical protein H7836_04675 [Magnetococcus sp. YQC-3]